MTLPDPLLADSHAHIHFDGRDFNLATTEKDAELFVNGKKRNKHSCTHEDRIRIGSAELEFSLYDEPVADDDGRQQTRPSSTSYKQALRVQRSKLMASYELPTLLDQLLDVDDPGHQRRQGLPDPDGSGEPVVKVARNLRRETIADAVSQLSDSIIEQVVKTQQAAHHLATRSTTRSSRTRCRW